MESEAGAEAEAETPYAACGAKWGFAPAIWWVAGARRGGREKAGSGGAGGVFAILVRVCVGVSGDFACAVFSFFSFCSWT
jgi:hypothetical protein